MPTRAFKTLYDIAEDQMGFVTTPQAIQAGVSSMTLVMMTRRGTLARVSRGVYRVIEFPMNPFAQYMQATLWPYERRGILSYETALSLYEMSDVDPAKIHITLPRGFRVQRSVPSYLVIHFDDLLETDIARFEGMPITTPERAVRDCMVAHLGPAIIRQAIDDGVRQGRLATQIADTLLNELN